MTMSGTFGATLVPSHDVRRVGATVYTAIGIALAVIVALALCGFIVARLGSYPRHLRERQMDMHRAETILRATGCSDPHKRAIIGRQPCDEAELVLANSPQLLALVDALNSFHVCRNNYCRDVIVETLRPFILSVSLLAIAVIIGLVTYPRAAVPPPPLPLATKVKKA